MKTVLARIAICSALFPLVSVATAQTDTISYINNFGTGPVSYGGTVVDNIFLPGSGPTSPSEPPRSQNLGGFNIVIVAGPGLAGNAPALAAFQRAANAWMARISDPITVTINADLISLGAGIIGSTSSTVLQAPYTTIRDAVVADAAADPNDAIMASTPTAAQFTAFVPSGGSLSGNLLVTKANAKALGFTGLDGAFGVSDATINFSSAFSFDFDNSNGVGGGQMDFETAAAHEIGHALGFVSFVDSVVGGATSISPFTLDLLRFRNNTVGQDPATALEFTTFSRGLTAGGDAITDAINDPEWRMSTGLSGAGTDGRQASHLKDDDLTGIHLGIMDPTLNFGTFYGLTDADWRPLDLIGYNIVPEPSSLSILLVGGAATAMIRRRRV